MERSEDKEPEVGASSAFSAQADQLGPPNNSSTEQQIGTDGREAKG